jgi:hypothetical protein
MKHAICSAMAFGVTSPVLGLFSHSVIIEYLHMLAGVRGDFPLRGLFIPCPLTVYGDVSSLTSLPRGNYLASGLQWFTLGREKEVTRSWLKLYFSCESFV